MGRHFRTKWLTIDSYDRLYVALPVANQILRFDDSSGAGKKS